MKTHKILFPLLLLSLFYSCSSDEETINFIGVYKATSIVYTDCDDPAENNEIWRPDQLNRFCYQDGDALKCFSLTIRIFEDGTFERVFIDQVQRGGFGTSNPDKKTGVYTIIGEDIEMCPDDNSECIYLNMNPERTALLWKLQGTTCKRTYTILKQ